MSSPREINDQLLQQYITKKDMSAYNKLAEYNIKCVPFVIKRMIRSYNPNLYQSYLDKYFDVGCVGLTMAIKTFSVDKIGSVSFSNYACTCIKNEILKAIALDKKEVRTISLDTPIDEDKDSLEIFISDKNDLIGNVIDREYNAYKAKKIAEALQELKPRQRDIISKYFGINGNKKKTVDEIAKEYGVTRQAISGIIRRGLRKISNCLSEFKDDYRMMKEKSDSSTIKIKK